MDAIVWLFHDCLAVQFHANQNFILTSLQYSTWVSNTIRIKLDLECIGPVHCVVFTQLNLFKYAHFRKRFLVAALQIRYRY